jgi:two-component system chemotaxis sensor kinase CheA
LDRLIDTIGELVILEQAITQSSGPRRKLDAAVEERYSALDKITREVQGIGTALRMVPIRGTFQRMARVVRDIARKQNKLAKLVTIGEEAEIDRSLVDAISDPLIHIICNAVDHGVEATPDERERAGKPREATITLRAYHRGGSVFIEITDDGRGLNRDRILAKSIERGLVQPGAVLTDGIIFGMIFEPGFSTADKVTDVSGRGVGMDVVKRTVESLRGRVDITSTPGQGTTISLRLPLTLAIIDGMVVRTGHERSVVPSTSIVRSVSVQPAGLKSVQARGELFVQDGEMIPALRLGRVVGLRGDSTSAIAVIVEDEGRRFALLVDEVVGQQQIVIKSLGPLMDQVKTIAGGAIMPDGTAGLILSLTGIATSMLDSEHAGQPQTA